MAPRAMWLPGDGAWQLALQQAPEGDRPLTATELDELLVALGDFVDLKSVFRQGHSSAVATLAADTARAMGLPEDDIQRLRRAGAIHDLGRLGVSNKIWDKATPLSSAERERVRLYPYFTQRIMGRVTGLGRVAALAGSHRELLDGSGYPKGVDASFLPVAARVLAAVGRSSRDIAAELVISEKTVRNHLEHIHAKAGVSNRASASLFAVQHGIVSAARVGR